MLRDNGYTISDGNVTETTSGYEKGHIKVIIKELFCHFDGDQLLQ
ncbi:MAG TPA: hypothetical protein PLJ38_05455 [bacterium]|nr:hypothetical protein [bacterium]